MLMVGGTHLSEQSDDECLLGNDYTILHAEKVWFFPTKDCRIFCTVTHDFWQSALEVIRFFIVSILRLYCFPPGHLF